MWKVILLMKLSTSLFAAGGEVQEPSPTKQKNQFKIEQLQALVDAGKYKTAVKKGLKLAKKTKDARAFNLVGYSFRNLKKYKKAIRSYKVALKLNPNLSIAKEYLAVAYLHRKKIKKVKKLYKELKVEDMRLANMLRLEARKLGVAL